MLAALQNMNPLGVYLYGFTRPGTALPAMVGVDDAEPVGALEGPGITAVVSPIDPADLRGPEAEKRLEDPQWLVPRACRHEAVLEAVLAGGPVLPVRFGAVFSSRQALADFMEENRRSIAAFLDAAADKQEWAVRGFLDAGRAAEHLLATDPELAGRLERLPRTPGARYFQEKQLRAEARRRVGSWGRQAAARLEEALREFTPEVRPLRLRPGGSGPEMLLHCALLLPRPDGGRLCEAVAKGLEDYADTGWTLECTGPWPPFHFAPTLGEAAP
jgi:hypothetical protein